MTQASATPARTTLAIDGGTPVRTAPFAPWPYFEADEIEAAAAVLRSGKVNYWTGEECRAFEREFAAFTGCRHAIALANGTMALELALYALGIGQGDEVIVPSRTFLASASCVVMRGARPVMADVDRISQVLTAETARAACTPRTKAIIPVHLAGWPCDMEAMMAFARERNLKVIEDCAQALGATFNRKPVGSFGHAAAFSFCQDKILTTGGEGGMLVTNDEALWDCAWSYKDHGKSFDAVYRRQHAPGFRWLHESFGTNWRMTEMQGALGRAILPKIPQQVARRREYAHLLNDRLARVPGLRLTLPPDHDFHAYYKFYAFVETAQLNSGWDRDRILTAISAEGVPTFSGSCSEIYLEKAFPEEWRPQHRLPVARELGETSLMFMVHPTLSRQDIEDTATAIEKVMRVAAK